MSVGITGTAAAAGGLVVLDVGLAVYDYDQFRDLCDSFMWGWCSRAKPAPQLAGRGSCSAGGGGGDPMQGTAHRLAEHEQKLADYTAPPSL